MCITNISKTEIISGSRDKSIKIWNFISGKCLKTFLGHTDYIVGLVKINANQFASSSSYESIKIWDISKLKETQSINQMNNYLDLNYFFKVNRTSIAIPGNDGSILIYDINKGYLIMETDYYLTTMNDVESLFFLRLNKYKVIVSTYYGGIWILNIFS